MVRKNSWNKCNENHNLIGSKKVDYSIVEGGTPIPKEYQDDFILVEEGRILEIGQRREVKFLIEDKIFRATIKKRKRSDCEGYILRINYNKELNEYFRKKFSSSIKYIEENRKITGKSNIIVPDEIGEYIEFYRTEEMDCYKLKLVLNDKGKKYQEYIGEPFESGFEDKRQVNFIYDIEKCSRDIGLSEDNINKWLEAIKRKGQAIIYGPPGTGKTYTAKKLAKVLLSEGDGFVDLVQFHPAYAYEDFIQGIRPKIDREGKLSYNLEKGRFIEICDKARKRKGNSVLIIDEINRANLSRVFGELMYLLEYRNSSIKLASGENFDIPKNIYIIGTMNTADRSIALVDNAIRRRFAFLSLQPNYKVLKKYHLESSFPIDKLISILKNINKHINDKRYELGISYFLNSNLEECIQDIWEMEIVPYLEEYFFDQSDKINDFSWKNIEEQLYGDV
ncbi:McrB family protein [Tepidibacter aestuarii]|uniref:McrB family protein n=1 Tax=Tepidibacter aestuarii TaxID=2925782 RepID=UPI0020BEF65F|nr:AAA family ATPase [Tepidibacter aestuarii]CAH2213361.1 5-methylcytosine-specific restriction enzyme B [Tepidibacter aestuarii]